MLFLPLLTLVCARCSISLRYFALLFPLQILLELRSERSWWIWLLLSSNFGVAENSSQFSAFSCNFCSDHLKSSATVKVNETAARVWVGWCLTLQSTSDDISCLETSTHEDGRPTANTRDCNLFTLHALLVVKMERGNETVCCHVTVKEACGHSHCLATDRKQLPLCSIFFPLPVFTGAQSKLSPSHTPSWGIYIYIYYTNMQSTHQCPYAVVTQ